MASKQLIDRYKQRETELTGRLDEIEQETEKSEKLYDELNEKLKAVSAEIEEIQRRNFHGNRPAEYDQPYEKREALQKEISVVNGLNHKLFREKNEVTKELSEIRAILDADEYLKEADKTLQAKKDAAAQLAGDLDKERLKLEKLKARLDKLNQQIDSIRRSNADLLAEDPEAEIDLTEEAALQQEARAVAASLEKQYARIDALQSEIDQAEEDLRNEEKSMERAEMELERARLMAEMTRIRPKVVLFAAINRKLNIPFDPKELFNIGWNEIEERLKQLDQ